MKEEEVLERWREYFQELLNGEEMEEEWKMEEGSRVWNEKKEDTPPTME